MTTLKRVLTVVTGVVLMLVPVQSRAQIHAPFSRPKISPDVWHGFEDPGQPGTLNTETSRRIQDGQLLMGLTSYGKTDSDSGSGGFAASRLRLNSPAGLSVLFVQITVQQAKAQPCANNLAASRPRARVNGAFFNDGSSSGPGDETGDLQVAIEIDLIEA